MSGPVRVTSTSPVSAARVTAFAFDTNPNVVSNGAAIVSGSVFDTIRYDRNLPNGVGVVELCFTVGLSNVINRFHATFLTAVDPETQEVLRDACPLALPASPA